MLFVLLSYQLKNAYKCGKRFYENYCFLPRYHQRTHRLTTYIATVLHDSQSIRHTAEITNVSPATVNRILDAVSYERQTFPEALSIDEFKGDTCEEKYKCILIDPIKHRALDILLIERKIIWFVIYSLASTLPSRPVPT